MRSVTRIQDWMPEGAVRSQIVVLPSATLMWAPATGVKPFGQSASTSRKFRTVRFPAAITASFVNGLFTAIASV